MTLWGGRFSEPSDDDLRALNDSLPFDKRMYKEDIQGSIAYARALVDAGILSAEESETIVRGLEQVREEFDAGTFEFKQDEDIHTAVERRLTEIVGDVGGKLHTGRSRNDQVATDFRLWTADAIEQILKSISDLQVSLVEQAERHAEVVMPGYTHLQPAQPIITGHWLMSYFWMFMRDYARLKDVRLTTMRVSPLGSGALAGTPLELNRAALAEQLRFEFPSENSLDGVSDRDFVADTLYALSMLGIHLSRLAEDLIIYSSPLF